MSLEASNGGNAEKMHENLYYSSSIPVYFFQAARVATVNRCTFSWRSEHGEKKTTLSAPDSQLKQQKQNTLEDNQNRAVSFVAILKFVMLLKKKICIFDAAWTANCTLYNHNGDF